MTGQIIQILEVPWDESLVVIHGQSASPSRTQGAPPQGRGPWLTDPKSLLATVGSLQTTVSWLSVVREKNEEQNQDFVIS